MVKSQTLKAIVLSLGLAALMAPATMNAQINRGLLQNPYKDQDNSRRNNTNNGGTLMRGSISEGGDGFSIETFGQNDAPLGSGLVILLGAGLGYVALKKKEDEQ